MAWLVFKHEEDFEKKLLLHLVKKAVFQFFLSLSNDGVGVEGLHSVAQSNLLFAPAVMVVRTIDVEGMLEDSYVIGVKGCRQEVLPLKMVDGSKPTQFGL